MQYRSSSVRYVRPVGFEGREREKGMRERERKREEEEEEEEEQEAEENEETEQEIEGKESRIGCRSKVLTMQ